MKKLEDYVIIMFQTIFLACHKDGKFKSEVINYIVNKFTTNKNLNIDYKLRGLIYNSFDELLELLKIDKNKKKCNVIIFLQVPNFSINQLLFLKKNIFTFALFEDVTEHYNTFYKFTQFFYDGLFIESGYRDFFEVYGKPVYNGEIFQHDIKLLDDKIKYESLIPFSERLYDFSFIGRFDRNDRNEVINQLKDSFKNIYFHDSSKGFISNQKLKYIIRNTKYLLNSTSIQQKNSYGFKQFPEYLQLQAKSRFIEYAANGCILFSEVLPINSLPTLAKNIKIPVVEIPRGVNKANYCLEYLNKNKNNIQEISRNTFRSVYESYMPNNINFELKKLLDEILNSPSKYSDLYLSNDQWNQLNSKYLQFFAYSNIKNILKMELSNKSKLIKLIYFIKSLIQDYNFFKITFLLIKMSFLNAIKLIKKSFFYK